MPKVVEKAEVLIQATKWGFAVIKEFEGNSHKAGDGYKDMKSMYKSAIKTIQWVNKVGYRLGFHSTEVSNMTVEDLSKKLEGVDLKIPTNLLHM